MPKVYVTQEVPKDMSQANKFGEIVLLTGMAHEVSMVRNSINNQSTMAYLRRMLKDYDPEQDFILPAGSPVMTGLVFMTLGALRGDQTVSILKWDKFRNDYIPIFLRNTIGDSDAGSGQGIERVQPSAEGSDQGNAGLGRGEVHPSHGRDRAPKAGGRRPV